MNCTCHAFFSPALVCADSARADGVCVSVRAAVHLSGSGISFFDIPVGGSEFFTLKACWETGPFRFADAPLLERIFITVTVAAVFFVEAVETVIWEVRRLFRKVALFLLNCVFLC